MRELVLGCEENDQLTEETDAITAAVIPELNLLYMLELLKEVAASLDNPRSTVRGKRSDSSEGKFTTFTTRIYEGSSSSAVSDTVML